MTNRGRLSISTAIMALMLSSASALDINIGGIHTGTGNGNGNGRGGGRSSSGGGPPRHSQPPASGPPPAQLGVDINTSLELLRKQQAKAHVRIEAEVRVPLPVERGHEDGDGRQRRGPRDILDLGEPTIRLMIGNLADVDRIALKQKCRDVLANPSWFDPALVALCQIIEAR